MNKVNYSVNYTNCLELKMLTLYSSQCNKYNNNLLFKLNVSSHPKKISYILFLIIIIYFIIPRIYNQYDYLIFSRIINE